MPGRLSAARSSRLAWPLTVLVALVLAGALAGVVWRVLWSPPTGVAFGGEFVLDGVGARSAFDATGMFVLIGVGVGLVAGVVVGWATRRDELLVLGTAVGGAVLATLVMYGVGHLLGPADPDALARGAEDYAPLSGDLEVLGWAPWLALPAGVLAGLVVTLLGFPRARDDDPALDPGAPPGSDPAPGAPPAPAPGTPPLDYRR